MSDNLNRVFLWCIPRTISTALTKCLSFIDGVQIVHEPYGCAFHLGPQRALIEGVGVPQAMEQGINAEDLEYGGINEKICTYKWVRDKLEASFQGKNFLISKDMAYTIEGNYDVLPRGFKYSFLIRHPNKVFLSWKTMFRKLKSSSQVNIDLTNMPVGFFPEGRGFKELYDLVDYVEHSLAQEPVIIDTDDLLSDPSGILSAYCSKMGLPYSPELLTWDEGPAITDDWIMSSLFKFQGNKAGGYYEAAFQSSGFRAPQPLPAFDGLDADIKACIKASMPYYEKLYDRRIKRLPATN